MKTSSTNSSIPITHIGQICLIQVPESLTLNQAVELKQQVQSICEIPEPPQQIILDFERTTFIDSRGVGALATVLKETRLQQIELVCWNFSSQVKMMLSMTGLDQVFKETRGTTAVNDFSISIAYTDHVCLIQIPKFLTLNQAVELKQQVQSICEMPTPPQQIILDFWHTTFIDSSGIGALVAVLKKTRPQQIELVCWNFSPQVKMMLSTTGLDQVFKDIRGTTAVTDSSISITHTDRVCVVQIPKFLTLNQAVELKQQVQSICEMPTPPQQIILDFGHTTFIDSRGIGTLVSILKSTRSQQIELVCWNFSSQVKMLLAMTGLDKVFQEAEGTTVTIEENEILGASRLATHPSVNSKTKRLIDIVGGLVGLGITALLFVPIAIAIQLDNPGPVLYSQVRCSWMGKQFRIWKFRSMVTNADELKHLVENQTSGPFFKNTQDPRVTRVGRFLRKTSLDEFPQFWNVLVGDMSLVGTRPPTPGELENYELNHWLRLNVKPGLTGEWQVHGRSKVTNFEEVVQLDLKYQLNWSLMYDLKLIFKTVLAIFSRNSGAV